MNLNQLHTNLTDVIDSMNELVLESAMENEKSITDLNTKQLSEGKTNQDSFISPEYSQAYAKKKRKKIPDLYLTGDFYKGFYAEQVSDYIQVNSDDKKTEFLTKRYKGIFGLTENNLGVFAQIVKPNLLNKIRDGLTRG